MIKNSYLDALKADDKVLYIFQHGSTVYGVTNPLSDIDFIVIVKDDYEIPDNDAVTKDNCQFIFHTITDWYKMMAENRIEVFECSALPKKFIHKEWVKIRPTVDKVELRKSISAVSENAYAKCKKKLLQGDYYIGKKSLWHSLRVALFGLQISKYGYISNFREANFWYKDIVLSEHNDWEYFKEKYQPLLNNIRTEFRKTTEAAWLKYKEQEKAKYEEDINTSGTSR